MVEPEQPPGRPPGAVALDAAEIMTGRPVVDAEMPECGRVHEPRGTGTVLHPYGPVRDHPVEPVAVELTGHGLVVADGSQPASGRLIPVGRREHVGELCSRRHRRRSGVERAGCGGGRDEVDVVVVEPGE